MKPRTDTNANNVDVRIVPSGTSTGSVGDITIGTTTGTTVSASNVASTYTSFSLTNNISKSGYLEVFTDTVRSLNNINNNNAYGTAKNNSNEQLTVTNAEVTDYNKAYNREPDYYTTKNVQLTDDRYLTMWDMKKTNVTNGYYPTMVMEGDNPVFGYIDNNGGGVNYDGAPASAAYYQRAKFNGSTGDEIYKEYLSKSLAGDQMGMAKDDGNRYIQVSVSNYSGDFMTVYYDRYAELHNSNTWSGTLHYNTFNGNDSYSAGNNAIAIDGIGSYTGRFQYPKVRTKGNSITGAAHVYIAYFDTVTKNINIRDFLIGSRTESYVYNVQASNITFTPNGTNGRYTINNNTNHNGRYVYVDGQYRMITRGGYNNNYYYTINGYTANERFTSDICTRTTSYTLGGIATDTVNALYSGGTDNNNIAFSQYTNIGEGFKSGNNYYDYEIADETHVAISGIGSKFYDMVITDDYHIVLIYYDEDNSSLKLVYSTESITGGDPTEEIEWEESSVSFPEYVGNYVSMVLDSAGGIHISAFDVTDSDLSYIYLDSYDATTCTHVSVDQFGSVGNWTQIKVNSANVPYIVYCNATEYGQRDAIKIAYAKDSSSAVQQGVETGTRYTTGNWEYMTVPSNDSAQGGDSKFQQVCLDFDSNGNPVVGYLGTKLEFGKQRGE